MSFLRNLISPSYYIGVLEGTRKFRVFIALLFLAALLTIQPSYSIFKHVYPVSKNIGERVTSFVNEVYPQELEINIKDGQASTNVTEPYYISTNTETVVNLFSLKEDDITTESKIRLLAIDTKGKADDFDRYQAMALLTQNSLVYVNDGETKINSLREVGDVTINKQFIQDKINEYNKDNQIGKFIHIGVIISPLIMFIGIYIGQLIFFFLMTLLVYFMVRINQVGLGFRNSFNYASLVTFSVSLVWSLFSLIPFMYSYLVVGGTLLVMIISALAYSGIHQLNSKEKIGGNHGHNP